MTTTTMTTTTMMTTTMTTTTMTTTTMTTMTMMTTSRARWSSGRPSDLALVAGSRWSSGPHRAFLLGSDVRWALHLCLCGLLLSHGAAQTFNRTDIVFVVSRFREKMDQLCYLAHYRHVVYNRGDASSLQSCGLRLVDRLENVGRESFVYLSFVVEHYDRLPPAMVFLQADNEYLRTDLAEFFEKATVTLPPENDGFAYLHPSCTSSRNANHLAALTRKYGQPAKDLLMHGHETLLHVDIKNPRYAGFGYFVVSRENVLRRPKSFYVELARRIGDRNDPYEGHFFERAWSEVFLSRCAADPHRYFCSLRRDVKCGD